MRLNKSMGSVSESALFLKVDSGSELLKGLRFTRTNFHNDQGLIFPCQQIDFPATILVIESENPVTQSPQVTGSRSFRSVSKPATPKRIFGEQNAPR